ADSSSRLDNPVFWYFIEPFDAAIFHCYIGVEAFGDSMGDRCCTTLFQQLNQPFLIRNKRVNLRRLTIQAFYNCILCVQRRNWYFKVFETPPLNSRHL